MLLQMQQQDYRALGRVDWELVTIALRPSREQVSLEHVIAGVHLARAFEATPSCHRPVDYGDVESAV